MPQYRVGSASVVHGSTVVSAQGGADWLINASTGNLFSFVGENVWYTIASVESDGSIRLETPYAGENKAAAAYAIHRDFTGAQGYPIPAFGDINTPALLQIALSKADAQMQYLASAPLGASTANSTFTLQRDSEGNITTDAGIVINRGSATPATLLFRDSQTIKRWEFAGQNVGKIGQLQIDGKIAVGKEPGTKAFEVVGSGSFTGNLDVASLNGLTLAEIKGVQNYADLSGKPTLGDAAAKSVGTGSNNVAAGNHTHAEATTLAAGMMSVADKVKLNALNFSSGTNWRKQPDNTTLQFNSTVFTPDANGEATITLPTAFNNASYVVIAWDGDYTTAGGVPKVFARAAQTANDFTIRVKNAASGAAITASVRMNWIAIGS